MKKKLYIICLINICFSTLSAQMVMFKQKSQFEYKPQIHQIMDFYNNYKHTSEAKCHHFTQMYCTVYKDGLSPLYRVMSRNWNAPRVLRQAILYGSADYSKVINYLVYDRVDYFAAKVILNADSFVGDTQEATLNKVALLFSKMPVLVEKKKELLLVLHNIDETMQNMVAMQQDPMIFFNALQSHLAQVQGVDITVVYTVQDLAKVDEAVLKKIPLQVPFDDLKERTHYFNENLVRISKPILNKAQFDRASAQLVLIFSEGEHDLALEHTVDINNALLEIATLLQNFYAHSQEYNLAAAAKIDARCKEIVARLRVIKDYQRTGIFAESFVGIVSKHFEQYQQSIRSYISHIQEYLFKEYYNPTPETLAYMIENTADLDYKAIDVLMKSFASASETCVFTHEFVQKNIEAIRELQNKGQFRNTSELYDSLEKVAEIKSRICILVDTKKGHVSVPQSAQELENKKQKSNSSFFEKPANLCLLASGLLLAAATCTAIYNWLEEKLKKDDKKDDPALRYNT